MEHYYQSHKSLDLRYRAAIRAYETPALAKRRAATPALDRRDRGSWFFAHNKKPRQDWPEVKAAIMRRADFVKYSQNPDLAARLLATGSAEIV